MEVLLRKDVDGLGNRGDVVAVSDGYARNFLVPRELAFKPTKENIKEVERERAKQAKKETAHLEELKQLAKKISTISCTVPVKVGEEGQVYGSVSTQDIVEALKNEDIEVDSKCVILDQPIRELGVYAFTVRLAPEIETESKVWVVED